jgi:hypothetical protein
VKREVWQRDQGRCAFIGTSGRCRETAFLEFHHVEPFAEGGLATVQNIQLRCKAHNLYEASLFFGDGADCVRENAMAFAGDSEELVPERAREPHRPFVVGSREADAQMRTTSPFGHGVSAARSARSGPVRQMRTPDCKGAASDFNLCARDSNAEGR